MAYSAAISALDLATAEDNSSTSSSDAASDKKTIERLTAEIERLTTVNINLAVERDLIKKTLSKASSEESKEVSHWKKKWENANQKLKDRGSPELKSLKGKVEALRVEQELSRKTISGQKVEIDGLKRSVSALQRQLEEAFPSEAELKSTER